MRYREFISEAPIGDFYVDNSADDYQPQDARTIQSNKFEKRVRKTFKNTPYVIDLVFIPEASIDQYDDDAPETNAKNFKDEVMVGRAKYPRSKPNVITLQIASNLSPLEGPRLPITPWIIGHKLGHSLQDKTNTSPRVLFDDYQSIDGIISSILKLSHQNYKVFGMKSARNGSLVDQFEVFPELMSEFLIKGKIALKYEEFGVNILIDKIALAETMLNQSYKLILDNMVGHSFIGV